MFVGPSRDGCERLAGFLGEELADLLLGFGSELLLGKESNYLVALRAPGMCRRRQHRRENWQ